MDSQLRFVWWKPDRNEKDLYIFPVTSISNALVTLKELMRLLLDTYREFGIIAPLAPDGGVKVENENGLMVEYESEEGLNIWELMDVLELENITKKGD